MRLFIVLIVILMLNSCNSDNNTKNDKDNGVPEHAVLSQDSKIFLGNRLFLEKTGITCHAMDTKKTALSVVDIMHVYKENNADIVAF